MKIKEDKILGGDGKITFPLRKLMQSIFENDDGIDDFVHGNCQDWAYLNWKSGDDFFVVTEFDEDIEKYALVHCGLYRDGKYIDARGSFDSLDEVLEEFDTGYDIDDEILSKMEFENFCKDYGIPLPSR